MSTDPTSPDAPISALQRFQNFRKSLFGRILLAVITLVVVIVAGYFVISKLISSIQQLSAAQTHISYIPVLVSLLITFICVVLGGATWYLTLRGIGCPLKIGSCTRIHLLANLAGYLPGYGWKHLGKAILTSRLNVPVQLASFGVLVEFTCLAITRLAITATFASPLVLDRIMHTSTNGIIWVLRVISWLVVAVFPIVLKSLSGRPRMRWFRTLGSVHLPYLWLAEAVMCLVWLVYGVGFAALLNAITPVTFAQYPILIFSTTASYLVSLLLFVVPAGLGIREAVIILALTGSMADSVVSLSSVLSRGVLIISELLGVGLGLLIGWYQRSKANKSL